MKTFLNFFFLLLAATCLTGCGVREGDSACDRAGKHVYNGMYSGAYNSRIAFPVGGLGAGMYCIEGTG
jgi:hypothetical protein